MALSIDLFPGKLAVKRMTSRSRKIFDNFEFCPLKYTGSSVTLAVRARREKYEHEHLETKKRSRMVKKLLNLAILEKSYEREHFLELYAWVHYTHAVNVHVYVCAQLHKLFFTGLCPKRKKNEWNKCKNHFNKMKGDVGMSLHQKEGNKKNLHQAHNPSLHLCS